MDIAKVEFQEEEETEQIVYSGELVLDEVLEFHQKHNKKPISWKPLLERIDEGDLRHKCTVCQEKFSRLHHFKMHALNHTDEKPYKCRMPNCTVKYQSKNGLMLHLMGHIGGPKYKCDECGETFNNQGSTYRHVKKYHSVVTTISMVGKDRTVFEQEDPYLDELLEFHRNLKAESEASEALTERIDEGNDKYKCKECGSQSSTIKLHLAHIVKHTGELAFKCKVLGCTAAFASCDVLKQHLKAIHYKGKKYICEVCGKKLETKKLLERHTDEDHVYNKKEGGFPCKYCDGLFPRVANALRHEKLHNPGNEKLLKCEFCDKVFLNGVMRKKHKIRDHGVEVLPWKSKRDEYFTCVKCFSSFIDKPSFEEHKEKCSFVVNENFQCRFCSKKFKEQLEYQQHEENFHNDRWKLLLMDQMESIYNEFDADDDKKPPSAFEVANVILDEVTPMWKKS